MFTYSDSSGSANRGCLKVSSLAGNATTLLSSSCISGMANSLAYTVTNNGTYIDVATDATTNISSGATRYTGGPVQSFNGNKLYLARLFSSPTNLYEYDISTGTATSIGSQGGDKYPRGTLAANGKIFWGPGGSTTFCEYDPATNTITNFI